MLQAVSLFVTSSKDLSLNALKLCRCVAYEIAAGIVITIFFFELLVDPLSQRPLKI